jgi:hypothetical protein
LRTALDHLASETVRSVGLDPKGVYFPICESIKKYESESDGKTNGMPKNAKDLIDRFRPYGGGNDYLWALHQLDILDKHRLLLTATTKVGGWSVTLDPTSRGYSFAFNSALKAGSIIGDVEGNHESDKQMSVTADVAFGEPKILEGEAIFPTLNIMAKMVEEVVSCFAL